MPDARPVIYFLAWLALSLVAGIVWAVVGAFMEKKEPEWKPEDDGWRKSDEK